ncbi:MAG: hypothetical protein DRN12_06810 [Thermoplasmata archaeon]|nr:MAG: hypothetical protein DRN12_06810 [Thermoplasmata archaeon]
MVNTTDSIIILFIASFLPPIIYAIWIRNTERYNRERWFTIAFCFIWGATLAVLFALILEVVLDISLAVSFTESDNLSLITVIIVAPFVEEMVKPMALRTKTVRKALDELEDGLIYGAIAGLGFSATENLFYGWSFLSEGLIIFITLMGIRSIGGCLLHASATALTGYGYGKSILLKTSRLYIVPYFLLAFFVHGLYNFLVSWEELGVIIGLGAALMVVYLVTKLVRYKIRVLDSS